MAPCLGSFECPSFHLAGGSFLATFGLPMVSIKLSHNLGDHSTYITYNAGMDLKYTSLCMDISILSRFSGKTSLVENTKDKSSDVKSIANADKARGGD